MNIGWAGAFFSDAKNQQKTNLNRLINKKKKEKKTVPVLSETLQMRSPKPNATDYATYGSTISPMQAAKDAFG
jgi:hypothetical protein